MRYVLTALVIFALLAGVLGIAAWGYSSVDAEFAGANSVEPVLKSDFQSVVSAIGHVVLGDFLGAPLQLIEGVKVGGTVDIRNSSLVPVYIPQLQLQLLLDGSQVGDSFVTEGGWLGPRGEMSRPIEVLLPLDDLPQLLLRQVFTGGDMPLEVEFAVRAGPLSFTKTTTATAVIRNPISQAVATTVAVSQYSFSPATLSEGGETMASLTFSGGNAGHYSIRLTKDISLAPDEIVDEFSFEHDGGTTRASKRFTPPRCWLISHGSGLQR